MTANSQLQKALLFLDRGNAPKGEALLRDAVSAADAERDRGTLVTALCAMGELLWQAERDDEARPLLERVLVEGSDYPPVTYEVSRANELLSTMRGETAG